MRKGLIFIILISLSMLMASYARAVSLALDPSLQTVGVGDVVSLDLTISGLGDFVPTSLGAFVTEITFDPNVLAFTDVVFDVFLGDPADPLETSTVVDTSTPGVVVLDEFSLLLDVELDALQPASFALADLTFTGRNVGSSAIAFGLIDLSDAAFPASSLPAESLTTASVVVTPEPASWLLWGTSALILLGLCRLRGAALPSIRRTEERLPG